MSSNRSRIVVDEGGRVEVAGVLACCDAIRTAVEGCELAVARGVVNKYPVMFVELDGSVSACPRSCIGELGN